MRATLNRLYTDISQIREALDADKNVEELLKASKANEHMLKNYTHRTPTAQEDNRDDKEFFDSHFNK